MLRIIANTAEAVQAANNDRHQMLIGEKQTTMESFEIEVATGGSSITYTVTVLEDGKFQVNQNDDLVGIVYPNTQEKGITWYTDDDIDDDLLENIGAAIEAEKM